MSDDDARVIGELTGRLSTFMSQYERDRAELRENVDKIFTKLDDISSDGCAVGRSNQKAIRALQNAPAKLIAGAAALISAIGAVIACLK